MELLSIGGFGFCARMGHHVRAAGDLFATVQVRQRRCIGNEHHTRRDLLVVSGLRFNLGRSDTANARHVRSDVDRVRAALQGDAARLDHVASDLERIAACVLIADDRGRYVAVNDKACELTGYSRAELLCKAIVDLTPPHAIDVYERLWDSFARTMKQYGFYKIKRKDGSVADVKYCAYTELAPGIHISFITAS
jgi:PAS domain S-box-containing protein